MKKRLLAFLAAGALAFGALTSTAFAQGAPAQGEPAKAEAVKADAAPAAAPAEAAKPEAAPAAAADAKPADAKPADAPKPPNVNKGDTAFMYVATIMVILMTIPGLALFYGGLVRSKNMLSVLMQVFVTFSLISVLWVVYGYSVAFTGGTPYFGGLSKLFLSGVTPDSAAATFSKDTYIPELLFVAFQCTFAAITCALIVGAYAERMKFSAVLLFTVIWFTFSYLPMAHMVWYWDGPDAIKDDATLKAVGDAAGWLWAKGALDFAGGTVVHINAGIAAFVAAKVVGARADFGRRAFLPHNVVLTVIGAGLLWFGWFGFNAGSALGANASAALAFANTMLAPVATLTVWTLLDLSRNGKATAVGAATAIVVGLVAVTPAAGFVGPVSAILLGAIAAVPSYFALLWRAHTSLDDSLDVVAAHGVGGTVGALLTGVLAQKSWNGVADGLLFGNPRQLAVQTAAVLAAIVYSSAMTWGILKALALVAPLRAGAREEGLGLDVTQHGEEAYTQGEGAILVLPDTPPDNLPAARPVLEPGGGV